MRELQWPKSKSKNIPIRERQAAETFLQQTQYLKDNVYTRVADLTTVSDVLAADIYHHNICVICYRNKYNEKFKAVSERKSVKSNAQIKFDLLRTLLNGLEKCLEQGYWSIISYICSSMCDFSENLDFEIYNRDVKKVFE